MNRTLSKRLVQIALAVATVLFVLSDAKPAAAQSPGCFLSLRICYYTAAATPSDFLDMWLRGLDCELDFTSCFRRAIFGR